MLTSKLVLEVLKSKNFPNPQAIEAILNYVPNPTVALEMLLGVYEPTVVESRHSWRKHKWSDSNQEIVLITSINDLGATLTYNVYIQNTKSVYYLTKEDYGKKENYVTEAPKDYYTRDKIKDTGYVIEERTCSIEDFNNNYSKKINETEAGSILKGWDMYGVKESEEEFNPYTLMV